MYIDNIFFQLSMSGTIVGICTSVLFAHDGSTAGDHPVGWVFIPSTDVHVGWLVAWYCIFTGCPLGTQYLSISVSCCTCPVKIYKN